MDEVLATREGRIVGLAVKHGLFRTRGFVVAPEEIRTLDHSMRAIFVKPSTNAANSSDEQSRRKQ